MAKKAASAELGTEISTVASLTESEVISPGFEPSEVMAALENPSGKFFSTLADDSIESKRKLYTALSDSEPINEHFGEAFELADFIAHEITIASNEDPSISVRVVRSVILTADGKTYHAVSGGIVRAFTNYFNIFGGPHDEAYPVGQKIAVVQEGPAGRRWYTVKLAD